MYLNSLKAPKSTDIHSIKFRISSVELNGVFDVSLNLAEHTFKCSFFHNDQFYQTNFRNFNVFPP